jgi:hypothetical protein
MTGIIPENSLRLAPLRIRPFLIPGGNRQECAENCFFIGCRYFDFRRESRQRRWCIDVSADGS